MSSHLDGEYVEIRDKNDVTESHIEEAMSCRRGDYGDVKLDWQDTISRVEGYREDWGSDMLSPAIKYLQREVNRRLREEAS